MINRVSQFKQTFYRRTVLETCLSPLWFVRLLLLHGAISHMINVSLRGRDRDILIEANGMHNMAIMVSCLTFFVAKTNKNRWCNTDQLAETFVKN